MCINIFYTNLVSVSSWVSKVSVMGLKGGNIEHSPQIRLQEICKRGTTRIGGEVGTSTEHPLCIRLHCGDF